MNNQIRKLTGFIFAVIFFISGLDFADSQMPDKDILHSIPADLKKHVGKLLSNSPEERVNSARKLGEMGKKSAPAVPFLIEILDDSRPVFQRTDENNIAATSPCSEAANALIKIGESAVDPLIAALRSNHVTIRENAARALGAISDIRAVEPLITSLKDENAVVRKNAAVALGEIGDPDAVEALIHSLKDEDPDVRYSAAQALGKIKDIRALEPLASALGDKKSKVQKSASEALTEIIKKLKDTGNIESLIALSEHSERGVRLIAFETMGKIKNERAIQHLISALGENDIEIRETAVEALKKSGNSAVEHLIAALSDKDPAVRTTSAMILGELKNESAVEPLTAALTDQDQSRIMRYEAAKALGKIGDQSAIIPLINALKDPDSHVREGAAEALRDIGKPVVEPLIDALKHKNLSVRVSAAIILGEIQDSRAVEPLINSLLIDAYDNGSWMFRAEAAKALGKIKDPRAIEPLNILSNDKDSYVRETALWALEEITRENTDKSGQND